MQRRHGQTGELPVAPKLERKGVRKKNGLIDMRISAKMAKIFLSFWRPSLIFHEGARLKPLDPGEVSKSVPRTSGHQIWWVIHRSDCTHGQPDPRVSG
ncbi:hypothetical protein AVEN_192291-1 [Araneus ventricosus]|uniref:Uncharacterized protein n=1 Tax=Araneus ventricosus TaxID=182803 RepID=A0A4Y2G7T8_ARAVE|nr:hypothetical protein AVEN_192291-1 [Araneus ventricosus]